MELLFNEQSLHGQFPGVQDFTVAVENLMRMRLLAKRYNRELYCNRSCPNAKVTFHQSLSQIVGLMDINKARALMSWLARSGPYWDDGRKHSRDEYLECQGNIVTDTAIGECAFLRLSNKDAQLVSFAPSCWDGSPLKVDWHQKEEVKSVSVSNHVSENTLEKQLRAVARMPESWIQLAHDCPSRFPNLYFSAESFTPLKGKPFVASAAKAILDLLDVLSQFKSSHGPGVGRSQVGHELYQEYFTGQQAWFTDSSDSEKGDFQKDMTFPHPVNHGERIFAPFHGKVKTPQMRIHFSWPVSAEEPLFVLYIGDKITKH